MITKKQPYVDPFTGKNEIVELNFHLNKNDLLQLEAEATSVGLDASLEERLTRIMNSGNSELIYNEFKRIVLVAYGRRQGSRFVKGPDISQDFSHSEEFSEFIFDLLNNPVEAEAFFTQLANDIAPVRAPLLSDVQADGIKGPNGDGGVQGPEINQNVFKQTPPETGPPVGQTDVEDAGMFNPDDIPVPAEGKKSPPRRLQQVEMEKMSFADVMKGVDAGRWTLPQ